MPRHLETVPIFNNVQYGDAHYRSPRGFGIIPQLRCTLLQKYCLKTVDISGLLKRMFDIDRRTFRKLVSDDIKQKAQKRKLQSMTGFEVERKHRE